MPSITITPVKDLPALAGRWVALEQAADGGFFRGWCFSAAQAARFGDPYLLAVQQDGVDLVLALLNRRARRLYAGQTGDAAQDAIFVEHSGLLVRPGAAHHMAACLAALCRIAPVVLSGVDAAHLAASRQAGRVVHQATRFSPAIMLQEAAPDYVATLSPNARAQIRRAMRHYGEDLAISRAPDTATALCWFTALTALHQQAWQRRGKPGAFADPALRHFHESLIQAAHPAGQADLLCISASSRLIGYLYNFVHHGRVYAYQSGFAAETDPRLKPGLVSHCLAIAHHRATGARVYDFLGGADRYKLTLAPRAGEPLHWLTLYHRRSPVGLAAASAAWVRHRFNLP